MTEDQVPISKMVELSTCHLQPHTCNGWLDEHAAAHPSTIVKHTYGWVVSVELVSGFGDNEPVEDSIPADLLECLRFAEKHDCRYVFFDADNIAVEGLTDYSEAWT